MNWGLQAPSSAAEMSPFQSDRKVLTGAVAFEPKDLNNAEMF
jgi:hypothetical protein